jgi:hypothetical protein
MVERTTIRLPEDLMRRAKRKAAAQGRSLTALIEDAVRRAVQERAPEKPKRFALPVSKATGGPMPGIDLNDSAALQELDDLEYVARMK